MITTYEVGTKEHKALEAAAKLLEAMSPNGTEYTVEDVYFDYGAHWMWTTVVAHRKDGTSWQALCPRDQNLITDDGSLEGIARAVSYTIKDKFNPDK